LPKMSVTGRSMEGFVDILSISFGYNVRYG